MHDEMQRAYDPADVPPYLLLGDACNPSGLHQRAKEVCARGKHAARPKFMRQIAGRTTGG